MAYILTLHTPEDDLQCQDLLKSAASHPLDGVKELELLWQHGMNNFNFRRGPGNDPVSVPTHREDETPYRTPLHIAALCGNADVVEWLIGHGAEASGEYYDMDPYDLAKSSRSDRREDVLAAFEKFPECRAARTGELCTIL